MINYNEEYEQEIRDIIKNNPKCYVNMLKSKGFKGRYQNRQYLIDYIYQCTPLLNDNIHTLKTRIYWTINRIKDFPICKNDKYGIHKMENTNVVKLNNGYPQYCNSKCQHEAPSYFENIKTTMKIKYGVDNAFQITEVKKKIHEKQDEITAKKKNTKLLNFGDPNFNNSVKANKTKIEKYGSVWNLKKCKCTWLNKYGVENPIQNFEIYMKQSNVYYMFNDIKFDSSWELAYYVWLKDNKIDFTYHPDEPKLWYCDKNNVKHRYYPDFIVNDEIIELKGDNAFNKEGKPIKNNHIDWSAKLKCMKDNNVKIILDDDPMILKAKEYINAKYGKNYLEQFRKIK